MLAVLGHGRADARLRAAGANARRPPPHPPCRDQRRGGVLPRPLRRASGRLRRIARLARRRRLARALRAPLRRRHRQVRRHRHRCRALSELECAAGRRHRADPGAARGGGAGRAGRRRRRIQRARRPGRGAAPGAALRPRPPGSAGAERAPGAVDGDDRRRPLPGPSRTRSGRWRSASSATSRCGGSTASDMPTSPTPCARSCSARPLRSSCCSSAGARWSTPASCARPTWRSSPPPTGRVPASSRGGACADGPQDCGAGSVCDLGVPRLTDRPAARPRARR